MRLRKYHLTLHDHLSRQIFYILFKTVVFTFFTLGEGKLSLQRACTYEGLSIYNLAPYPIRQAK